MNIRPVSFGSLMVFTLNDNKPRADVPSLVKTSFHNNKKLKHYKLAEMEVYDEKIDGTVHNAARNFAEKLDKLYERDLPKGSKKVRFTEVEFYVNPRDTQKRYFLTAATNDDEKKLHEILSQSSVFYTARF